MLGEESLDGSHLVISVILDDNETRIPTHALVDCGATGYTFIDEEFVRHHKFPLYKLQNPRVLEVIDGRPIESGTITHMTKLRMIIDKHQEELPLFITNLGHYPMVLGIPWIQ